MKVFAVLAGVAALGAGWWLGRPDMSLQALFLNVGQGDATWIGADGLSVLVDTGPQGSERRVLPILRDRGIDRIDLIFLTHPDSDHIGGLDPVLKAYPEARLVVNRAFRQHPEIERLLVRHRKGDKDVLWVTGTWVFRWGETSLRAYGPAFDGERDNDASLALHINRHDAKMTLTGDLSSAMESLLARDGDWQADLVQIGHHGSRGSGGEEWLKETQPEFAVISCGRDNPYGHPHPDLLRRLETAKVKVARTDRQGNLHFYAKEDKIVLASTTN